MTASATILTILVSCLAILLAIGLWGRRGSATVEGYYVAGKQLPTICTR